MIIKRITGYKQGGNSSQVAGFIISSDEDGDATVAAVMDRRGIMSSPVWRPRATGLGIADGVYNSAPFTGPIVDAAGIAVVNQAIAGHEAALKILRAAIQEQKPEPTALSNKSPTNEQASVAKTPDAPASKPIQTELPPTAPSNADINSALAAVAASPAQAASILASPDPAAVLIDASKEEEKKEEAKK